MAFVLRSSRRTISPSRTPHLEDTVRAIQDKVAEQAHFWSKAHGWAPKEAADLLSGVRLEHYASLALNLDLTLLTPQKSKGHETGRLILAWSHLGSMLECTLQLFLGVWLRDYLKDKNKAIDKRSPEKPKLLLPHELTLEPLRVLFNKSVWNANDRKTWTDWVVQVQQRRNAIHALKPRPLGTWIELENSVRKYYDFLTEMDGRLPYP